MAQWSGGSEPELEASVSRLVVAEMQGGRLQMADELRCDGFDDVCDMWLTSDAGRSTSQSHMP